MEIDIKPYIGKGYTLQEILKISEKDEPKPMWDCPYANDWCEEDDEINTLCDNKFEPINEEQREYDILYEPTYNLDDESM